jgi:UDP-GlcNAc:undecaprenyl-phosphate GlcNAc-1-phosphate transferase
MTQQIILLLFINFFLFKLTNYFFLKFNLLDIPEGKLKKHKIPTPYNGGIVLLCNIIFIIFSYLSIRIHFTSIENLKTYIFFTLLFSIFLICFIDDIYKISANIRFFVTLFLLFIFFFYFPEFKLVNMRFDFIKYSVEFHKYSLPISVFCMLAFIQAANMLDGINGQLSIYVFFILLMTNLFNTNISIFLIPFLLVFIINNLRNKSFLGDSGSYLLAICVGLLLINLHNNKVFYADQIFLIISIPGYDMIRLFVYRIIHRRNPFNGDRLHIHHLFLNKFQEKVSIFFSSILLLSPLFFLNLFESNIVSLILSLGLYIYCVISLSKKN